jgi:hypothetical protein
MPAEHKIARLISNILGPFFIGPLLILLLVLKIAATPSDAIRWALLLIVLTILPGLIVFIYLVKRHQLASLTQSREQRTRVYLLASIFAGVGLAILVYFDAPAVIVATFVTGLAMLTTFMLINLRWKISIHTAYITASATIAIILYGLIGLAFLVLMPLIAWARLELKHHTLAQVTAGALLAALFAVVIFHFFGLA